MYDDGLIRGNAMNHAKDEGQGDGVDQAIDRVTEILAGWGPGKRVAQPTKVAPALKVLRIYALCKLCVLEFPKLAPKRS